MQDTTEHAILETLRGARAALIARAGSDPLVHLVRRLDAIIALADAPKSARQDALVGFAQELGFKRAQAAYWNPNCAECGVTSIHEELSDHAYDGEVLQLDLGVYLNDSVHARLEATAFDADGDAEDTVAVTYDETPGHPAPTAP